VFKTARPLGFAGETALTFRLEQDFGGVRTIGRLRLSAFTDPELPVAAARSVPSDIVAILDTTATQRTKAQTKRLTEFYRAEDKLCLSAVSRPRPKGRGDRSRSYAFSTMRQP